MGQVIYLADFANKPAVVEPEQIGEILIVDKIAARYPNLVRGQGCVAAAKNMRIELKIAFPGVKFSIRSSKYSGGNSIRVSYVDGPIAGDVEGIVKKYAYGNFDGMDDSYKYSDNVFASLFGGSYYVFVDREYSQESVEQAIDQVAVEFGNKDKINFSDWKNGEGYNKYPGLSSSYEYNWQQLVRLQLGKMDFFNKALDMYA